MLTLFIFAVVATITPGPNNIMLMSSASNYGYYKSLPLALSIVSGFMLMFVSVSFGFTLIFKLYPYSLIIIKYIGFTYLMYLAWRIASVNTQQIEDKKNRINLIGLFFFQWINPKSWIVVTSTLGAYVKPEGNYTSQVMMILGVFLLAAITSSNTWLIFGRFLKNWLDNPQRQKRFNQFMALLLVATILPEIVNSIKEVI